MPADEGDAKLRVTPAELTCSGRLSRSGSVPLMASQSPAPRTTTPQRCSVAYLTATVWRGKPGIAMPAPRRAASVRLRPELAVHV